ncbi:quinone oxidoreductase [Coprinopsis marcescibilis]|uniref:Quinone oxidoreductase n=1 Tax=Coprinopsis marcescibilis TaxID=230819 RepID=A0A5C3L410_COPMA|nr:quinone oxidoreductase [Coprinopsis marcescibilis]
MSSPAIPDTQKAWVEVTKGKPEQGVRLKTDWPVTKSLEDGDVLVKIQAAALNPAGYKMLGMVPDFLAKRPVVAEFDFAGVVVDTKDSDYQVGDEVCGFTLFPWRLKKKEGALAEYIRVPAKFIIKRPSNLSPIEGSGICLAGMTAFQALDEAKLEEGQTLFVNGGSTAVGSFAIQLAKARGAKVVAVASGKNEKYVRDLGADEFIDYTQVGPLHKHLVKNPPSDKYNVILEAVGLFDPSLYTFSKAYLAPNGVYISVGPQPKLKWKTIWDGLRLTTMYLPSFLTGFKATFKVTWVEHDKERFAQFRQLIEEGKVKPLIDSVFSFEDVLKAYERLITQRATGKVVVKVSV